MGQPWVVEAYGFPGLKIETLRQAQGGSGAPGGIESHPFRKKRGKGWGNRGLHGWGARLFVLVRAEEEDALAADDAGAGAGEVGGGGDAAEEDEEIPEGAESVFEAGVRHGENALRAHSLRRGYTQWI